MTSKELLYLTIMSGNGTDGTEIDFLKERGFLPHLLPLNTTELTKVVCWIIH